jgi:hypothetical protein
MEEASKLFKEGEFSDFVEKLRNASSTPADLLKKVPEIERMVWEIHARKNDYSQPLADTFEAAVNKLPGTFD